MAEVFLARLVGIEGFEKRVVLKRVLPHLSGDARFLQRFIDEARVAAALSHPNIVQIFELGEQHGQYFIAMEHVDGRNLKDVAKRLFTREERVPVEHAVRIGAAVLDALHYAHTRVDAAGRPLEVVHRDVSPANVLVSFEGVVKLIDFGIARHTERPERTNPGTVVGKAGYMAPEQMRGERVDARTDVFACAATLFHVVTGVLPFPGVGVAAVMHAVNHGERRPYDEIAGAIDEELFGLLTKGCAHEPGERFESALEMQTALERYAIARGVTSSTAALGDFMRRTFAGAAEDDGEDLDPETQSRVVTLAGAALTQGETKGEKPSSLPPATVTLERAPTPAWMALLVVAAVMVALGAGLAWWMTRGGEGHALSSSSSPSSSSVAEPETASASASASATAAAPATEPDAATATATATESEPEAEAEAEGALASETKVEAAIEAVTAAGAEKEPRRRRARARRQRAERTPPPAQREPASLTLDSEPWSEVSVNGWRVGLTPVHALELPPGQHTVRLVNPERKLERTLSVTLRAGESRRMKVKLP